MEFVFRVLFYVSTAATAVEFLEQTAQSQCFAHLTEFVHFFPLSVDVILLLVLS